MESDFSILFVVLAVGRGSETGNATSLIQAQLEQRCPLKARWVNLPALHSKHGKAYKAMNADLKGAATSEGLIAAFRDQPVLEVSSFEAFKHELGEMPGTTMGCEELNERGTLEVRVLEDGTRLRRMQHPDDNEPSLLITAPTIEAWQQARRAIGNL